MNTTPPARRAPLASTTTHADTSDSQPPHQTAGLADEGISIVCRENGVVEREVVLGERGLRWLYRTGSLPCLARAFLNKRPFSAVFGLRQRLPLGQGPIRRFVDSLGIDASEAARPLAEYRSLNEFFTRRLKPGARPA